MFADSSRINIRVMTRRKFHNAVTNVKVVESEKAKVVLMVMISMTLAVL